MERLELEGITLRYGDATVLEDVDLRVASGEVHALLGENGAGKSSLMQVLVGAVTPQRGTMRIDGVPHRPTSTAAAARAGVAMVFQELSLVPALTVAQNLWLGREHGGGPFRDRRGERAAARAALARVRRSDLDLDRRVATLGPADRQLVEIARALLADARVLVLDEPTSSLGADDAARLFELLGQLRGDGLAIVLISHVLEEVRAAAERCTVLRDGRVVASGAVATFSDQDLVARMAGRTVASVFPPRRDRPGAAVLEVEALAGDPLPVRASLTLHRGEIVGIGGLAGSGRTELLQVLFGARARSRGRVQLRGEPGPATPAVAWRRRLGFLAEDRQREGLALRQSVARNMVLPELRSWCRGPFVRRAALVERVRSLAAAVSLRFRGPDQPVRELSGGNQQKVAIARLLHAGCDVLLLDEPTRGIDVGSRQEVYRLLDGLARNGAAILVVGSHLPELLGLCDRIAILHRGVLGPFRPADTCSEESLLHEALCGAAEEVSAP